MSSSSAAGTAIPSLHDALPILPATASPRLLKPPMTAATRLATSTNVIQIGMTFVLVASLVAAVIGGFNSLGLAVAGKIGRASCREGMAVPAADDDDMS